MKTNRRRFFKLLTFVSVSLLALSSCSKKNEEVLPDGVSTYVKDLPGDTLASMGEVDGKERRQFYPLIYKLETGSYRLIKNAQDSLQYLKTEDWDIAFSLEYNSFVVANNGNNRATPGYQGPGTTKLIQVNTSYESVMEAPSDSDFDTKGIAGAGWDSGTGIGWYFYSLNNHIAVPIKSRTYLIKTNDGKYGKLEMQNIYKGNPSVVTDLFWPAPYLSFRFFIQKDGSKNLRTK